MIRLTNLADYGVVLMAEVASRSTLVSTADLCAETGLPSATVSKLMNILTRRGLVVSQRGAQGGFQLGRAPQAITIADVVEAIEGPIALTQCTTEAVDDCCFQSICKVRPYWTTINEAVRTALGDVTLAQLTSQQSEQSEKPQNKSRIQARYRP